MTTPLASYLCDAGANALLNLELGGVAETISRSSIYLLLGTQPSNKLGFTDDIFSHGARVGGGSYYPAILDNTSANFPNSSGGVKTNANTITWPQAPTTDWGLWNGSAWVLTPVASIFIPVLSSPFVTGIATTTVGDTSITFLASTVPGNTYTAIQAASRVYPGQKISLTGSTGEVVKAALTWTPGSSATVPITTTVVHSGQTTGQVDVIGGAARWYWDITPVSIPNGSAAPSIAAGALTFSMG